MMIIDLHRINTVKISAMLSLPFTSIQHIRCINKNPFTKENGGEEGGIFRLSSQRMSSLVGCRKLSDQRHSSHKGGDATHAPYGKQFSDSGFLAYVRGGYDNWRGKSVHQTGIQNDFQWLESSICMPFFLSVGARVTVTIRIFTT